MNGSIGANDIGAHISMGKSVTMPDDTAVMADSVRIGEHSNVFSVEANQLFFQPTATIRDGSTPAVLPLIAPFCATPVVSCGGPDVGVEVNETSGPLPPGSYGTVLVRNGGALSLAPGTFDVCRLLVGRGGRVEAQGDVTINVKGGVRLGTEANLTTVSSATPVVLNVAGRRIQFGQNSVVRAIITAPKARLQFRRHSLFDGCFCVDVLRDGKDSTLESSCSAP